MINYLLKKILPLATLAVMPVFLSSCGMPAQQPRVTEFTSARNYAEALSCLKDSAGYGKNNRLLFLLDRGFVEHIGGKYEASIRTFEEAKNYLDELYTKSLTGIAGTWLTNDYSAPYRGEDFEAVLIHIFQAINYAKLNRYDEALVEARQVDTRLGAINSQFAEGQKNTYREDAFARFLMGIFYEAGNLGENVNDAFISYSKAAEIYKSDYLDNYGVELPRLLKQNLLTTADYMGLSEFSKIKEQYPQEEFFPLDLKRKQAEIYLIHYNGLSPRKAEASLAVPLADGHIVKLAFPRYKEIQYRTDTSQLVARSSDGRDMQVYTETGEDIGAIAVKNLENRRLRFLAKTSARASGRYLLEKNQEQSIQSKFGDVTAAWFRFFANIFNVMIEKADLRSWQTLPDEIRISRLLIEPGEYEFFAQTFCEDGKLLKEIKLGVVKVGAGDKKLFIVHTTT